MRKKRTILSVAIALIVMVSFAWFLAGDMLRNNWRFFDNAKSDSSHTYVTVRIVDDENAPGILEPRC